MSNLLLEIQPSLKVSVIAHLFVGILELDFDFLREFVLFGNDDAGGLLNITEVQGLQKREENAMKYFSQINHLWKRINAFWMGFA